MKPSNMLMDVLPGRPDHVYLSDFGLSKAVASTSGLTSAGMVLGTLAYMSPEQIAGQPVDSRADQYALACSAFELLAGSPPFERDEPTAVMYAHLLEPPPQEFRPPAWHGRTALVHPLHRHHAQPAFPSADGKRETGLVTVT